MRSLITVPATRPFAVDARPRGVAVDAQGVVPWSPATR